MASGNQTFNLLSGDLRGRDLSGANLEDAVLNDRDLTGANLSHANLSGADLSGANLTGANLYRAILKYADLTSAVLTGTDLTRADLTGAVLTRARIFADLSGANLSLASLLLADLTNADLTNADLTRANLTRANLTGAILNRPNFTRANLTGANLTRANLNRPNFSRANLTRTIGVNLQGTLGIPLVPLGVPPPPPEPIMREINSKLNVFDPLIPGDVKASVFFEENEDYEPFIIRTPQGLFNGNAINWPVASSSGKYFVECKDNTPSKWEGNSYGRYIKHDGRTFIKMGVGGTLSLVEKPDWYDTGSVPGTKYFNLVKSDNVTKFMTSVLAEQTLPEDFTALGSDHCNQSGPSGTYKLVQISHDELSDYAKEGGKRQRKTKIFQTKSCKTKSCKTKKCKTKKCKRS